MQIYTRFHLIIHIYKGIHWFLYGIYIQLDK